MEEIKTKWIEINVLSLPAVEFNDTNHHRAY